MGFANEFINSQKERLWQGAFDSVDGSLWNKTVEYSLGVVKRTKGYSGATYTLVNREDIFSYIPLEYTKNDLYWKYSFRIPPQSLQIPAATSIVVTPTLNGVVEEHNAMPIRSITIAGTTGVLPYRGTGDIRKNMYLIGGIIDAVNTTYSALGLFEKNVVTNLQLQAPSMKEQTGYYQFRKMQQFIEQYLEFKKQSTSGDYFLVFSAPKDEAHYLVAPMGFSLTRSSAEPFSYNYNISFKSYGRIKLDVTNTYIVQNYTMSADRNLVDLARSYINKISNLAVVNKNIINSVAGLTSNVVGCITDATVAFLKTYQFFGFYDMILVQGGGISDYADSVGKDIIKMLDAVYTQTDKSLAMASDPNKAPQEILNKINNTIDSINAKATGGETKPDVETMTKGLKDAGAASDAIASAFGMGNTLYDEIYYSDSPSSVGLKVPSGTLPTDQIISTLGMFNNLQKVYSFMLADSGEITSPNVPAPVEYVAAVANEANIEFKTPISKFLVPFPYGGTLEELATKYLQNPDRWLEIATLNRLRAPYIDEDGFKYSLSSNGVDNSVVVTTVQYLTTNQTIYIGSDTLPEERRRIVGIHTISDVYHIITLDGDSDLAKFTTAHHAYLHGYLPNTISSKMSLYIPSDTVLPEDVSVATKALPGIDDITSYLEVGGIDLLLTQENDLIITPDGDCKLAIGLANIVQTVRTRLQTPLGELNRHPEFGLTKSVGQNISDISFEKIAKSVSSLFANDPDFSSVTLSSIEKKSTLLSLKLSVYVRDSSKYIPLNIDIRLP